MHWSIEYFTPLWFRWSHRNIPMIQMVSPEHLYDSDGFTRTSVCFRWFHPNIPMIQMVHLNISMFQMVSPEHLGAGGRTAAEGAWGWRQLPGSAQYQQQGRLHALRQVSINVHAICWSQRILGKKHTVASFRYRTFKSLSQIMISLFLVGLNIRWNNDW